MTTSEHSDQVGDPTSFFAASAALRAADEALRTARTPQDGPRPERGQASSEQASSEQALAALLLLRELREQLAGWEAGLIEAARAAGTSWADLAHPLGVASRQAAERRYLRVRPGPPGTTGEERVQATRDRRAADRTVTGWARDNAAHLRQLAGQIIALTDLPAGDRGPLTEALADNDAARLLAPLLHSRAHLEARNPDLAARVDTIAGHTDELRRGDDSPHRTSTDTTGRLG
ncbi:type III effector protein [Streptomyces sp. NPDC051320]|uniref:type III effector protein n=1 Tax=Streptomyces sp. NPDC051320 TaxID=3154644 RepID=UPI00343B6E9F